MERLVLEILPVPHQLDPSPGSYYSNSSGLFRGDVRYYHLSSIPLFFRVWYLSKITFSARSSCLTLRSRILCFWSLIVSTPRKIVLLRACSTGRVCHVMRLSATVFLTYPQSSFIDVGYIPSVVPASAQNATALVLRDEMTNRLSKLKTTADWTAMLEELSYR